MEERFHKLADYIWYRYYIKTGLIFPIVLKAIRQVHVKSNIFVTIGYFEVKGLRSKHLSVKAAMMY